MMWSYTNNKIKLLTNYNTLKTNIRMLCIYSNKNSTQYIIILHLFNTLECLFKSVSHELISIWFSRAFHRIIDL